jgi:multiple sugar transport system substrate-binding protein
MRRTLPLLAFLLATSLAAAQSLTFWTTEEQPQRIETQQAIAAAFEAETGIAVDVVPVTESSLGERMTAAFAAGDLPDVVFHPVNYTIGWAEAGILDTAAATESVANLGVDTFGAGALALMSYQGESTAVPTDGWTQLLLYRADLFAERGLAAPTSYEAILAAARALHDPPNVYGFVAATDPSQDYMMQVVEHLALANGVQLIDDEGNVTIDTPAFVEFLEFYKELAELSPPGNLYWLQSRELFQSGQAAMVVWSPFILDELAGLRDEVPVLADEAHERGWLARNTGFVTSIAGPSNPAGSGYAQVSGLGITVDADIDAAQAFVEYLVTDGYLDWLGMAAEGKFPVRGGTPAEPARFVEGWAALEVGVSDRAPLGSFYAADVIDDLVAGLETGDRWAFRQGQGALVTSLYGTRVMSEAIRRYLDGELTAEATAALIQLEVESLR